MQGGPAPAHRDDTHHLHLLQPAKSRSLALLEHTGTELSSFMGSVYQTGLVLLVFVLPPHPQTLQHPCPVPRPERSSAPALLCINIYTPNLHSQALCSLIHASNRQGPKCSALSIVHTILLYIYKKIFLHLYLYINHINIYLYINHTHPLLCS